MSQGSFIISLDFELYWGVRDVVRLEDARDHFLRARDAIPEMLRLFEEHEVHATWATVGFLFARSRKELLDHLPDTRPAYREPRLDPYRTLDALGEDEKRDPFHFARSLLERVADTPGQEIASHTFSHFYCLEDGQTEAAFEADLRAAAAIGAPFGAVTQSLVFPRGQHNPAYDDTLARFGVGSYRIPPQFAPYRPRKSSKEHVAQRALRLLDTYAPVGGSHVHPAASGSSGPLPLRAGLFLRPYAKSRRRLEPLRKARLRSCMERAARRADEFHLWWHPHNFGTYTRENLALLRETLGTYRELRDRYAWPSRTMGEVASLARSAA